VVLAWCAATLVAATASAAPSSSTPALPVSLAGEWRTAEGPLRLPESLENRLPRTPVLTLQRTVSVPPDLPLAVVLSDAIGIVDVVVDGVAVGQRTSGIAAAFPVPPALSADGVLEVGLTSRLEEGFARTTRHAQRLPGLIVVDDVRAAALRVENATLTVKIERMAPALLMASLFGILGVYHVLLWWLHRSLLAWLAYAGVLFCVAAWGVLVATVETDVWPALSSERMWAVAPGTAAIGGVFFVSFVWRFLRGCAPPRAYRLGQVVTALASLACFLPGDLGLTVAASPARNLLFVILLLAVDWIIVRDAWRGSTDARIFVVGFIPVAIFICAQVLALIGLAPHTPVRIEVSGFFLLLAAMAVALARRYAATVGELDATNAAISRFVPFKFLSLLQKDSVRSVQRGDSVQLTLSVMFCDIRGFTTLAEAAGPDATFAWINRYLSVMEPEIHKEGGYINQYLGDGIMALFPTSADAVLRAAAGMTRALAALNVERAGQGLAPLNIGIGIHTGPLMLGTIGGGAQLDAGVVGDVVNVAARVEGMTKQFGCTVLVGEATVAALSTPAAFALRELDSVRAKGKTKPLTVFELLDAEVEPSLRVEKQRTRDGYAAALSLYRAGRFADARAAFAALAAPGDRPLARMIDECEQRLAAPPAAWDGVTTLLVK
jgi:class 3 adenylate cyclase